MFLRFLLGLLACALVCQAREFNVRDFGAKGDGVQLDSPAINAAIEAAAKEGGGCVYLPAGTYLSFSLRLCSRLTLRLEDGARLLAADPAKHQGQYDAAEPNAADAYQDFGHSHWRNSLLWGENLEDLSIVGPGLIDGSGLTKRGPPPRSQNKEQAARSGAFSMEGQGNKAIALKLCRNVTLRDFSVLNGGHFALLATGVDNLSIDNLKVDSNRDGFDIDACRNVRISNSSVNTPNDDAIVLKASYGLGFVRDCENITISNCLVSGYDVGTLLDGRFLTTQAAAPDRDGPTGRIKIGTESNGSFRNITITNCVFDHCRGLALETVDGGTIEDVSISNLTMRNIKNSPIFLRLGNRARGPEGTPVGALRRVNIANVVASGVDSRYALLVTGIPGHPIEDLRLSNLRIHYLGGLSLREAEEQPESLVNPFFQRGPGGKVDIGPRKAFEVPEREKGYPEPSMFGVLPASALYLRHVRGLSVDHCEFSNDKADARPAVVLQDARDLRFDALVLALAPGGARFVLRDVSQFLCRDLQGTVIQRRDTVSEEFIP